MADLQANKAIITKFFEYLSAADAHPHSRLRAQVEEPRGVRRHSSVGRHDHRVIPVREIGQGQGALLPAAAPGRGEEQHVSPRHAPALGVE